MLDADGFLAITDRKKDIIVTAGGKNIAPSPSRTSLKTNPLIAEIVMIGDKRNFPVRAVVPNFANLEKWAREQGIAFASREALVADPRVAELYDRTVKEPHEGPTPSTSGSRRSPSCRGSSPSRRGS